eukprot:2649985-Rhodomonas_salina.3
MQRTLRLAVDLHTTPEKNQEKKEEKRRKKKKKTKAGRELTRAEEVEAVVEESAVSEVQHLQARVALPTARVKSQRCLLASRVSAASSRQESALPPRVKTESHPFASINGGAASINGGCGSCLQLGLQQHRAAGLPGAYWLGPRRQSSPAGCASATTGTSTTPSVPASAPYG